MKDTALQVNVARGQLIDTSALRTALVAKPAMLTCLDVMPEEPWPAGDETLAIAQRLSVASSSPLWLDNLAYFRQGLPLLYQVKPDHF